MVITNNYKTYERGRRKEEEVGLRRRRSRAGRAANKLPEPLVRNLTRMSSSRVVRFDFHQVIIESGEGVVERDAGHLPARESRRGHGEADDAARGGGGLTAIRSASTKAALVHGPARARGRVASTRGALRRPANRWSIESLVTSLRSPSRRTRLVCQRCDYVSLHLDR